MVNLVKRVAPSMRAVLAGVVALVGFSHPAAGQGGPPFRSDDPDTPGNKRWEINTLFAGSRGPSEGSYVAPNIDINYGIGSRIQLKFEVPLSIHESRENPRGVAAGLGNSLLGVKWRFYAHHPKSKDSVEVDKKEANFGLSIYPQLMLNNPTSSLRRDVAEPGPQFFLPMEANVKLGPLRISGEIGRWFTNKDVPASWMKGIIVGHEFKSKIELYGELYDQVSTQATLTEPRTRDSTIGVGFRTPVIKNEALWLMGMVGRSLVAATPANGQPTWIASVGLQILTGKHRRSSAD
jgi:hypothetical protein